MMPSTLRNAFGSKADAALVAMVLCILFVLFAPIPARLLDFLLLLNLGLALLVLLLSFHVEKPVHFSTFPALLLVTTLFRLALNIAATRLILSSAEGGRVIGTIGSFVVAGNFVIGLIVFLILVAIQYLVVTSGAQRVAEVAARFTLDSMPGQQMSIDADLNMGFIDQAEAQRRRRNIEKEASFYGAMDGASKFVKGDAIAGIVILLVDMLGGWAIGVLQQGMKWDQALRTFTLLTIGDGIATQVPALVIALGTGLIVTRSSSDQRLSAELAQQLTALPKTLLMVALALSLSLLLPGMPATPVLILAAAFALVGWMSARAGRGVDGAQASGAGGATAKDQGEDLYAALAVDPVEVRVGPALSAIVNDADALLAARIALMRKSQAQETGFIMPPLRMHEDRRLGPDAYEVSLHGVLVAQAEVRPGCLLAIAPEGNAPALAGEATRDPSYGLPALWIAEALREEARRGGYTLVDPATVFLTHMGEVLRQHAATLLDRAETERLVEHLRKADAGLVEELVPTILTLGEVQKVLQELLREQVSIRNLGQILEVLTDQGRHSKDTEMLTELVRQKLGPVICQSLAGRGADLRVLTLDPAIEQAVMTGVRAVNQHSTLVLEPQFAEQLLARLAGQAERMARDNARPVLLVAPDLRRHVRRLTERLMPQLAVISMAEIPQAVRLRAFGVVTI